MRVILAEKPDMGENIAKALGISSKKRGHIVLINGDIVTWGIGHLIRLKEPDAYDKYKHWTWDALPVIPERMDTEVDPKKIEQFNIVKSLLQQCQECILATDPDREGEYIGRLILSQCGYQKKWKRLWIDDLTEKTIRAGMQKLRESDEFTNLGAAAQARAYADYWLGFTASRFFSLLAKDITGSSTILSAGRVQTPTLRLVYERELEMDNFVPQPFHTLTATFHTSHGQYKGQWYKAEGDASINRFEDATLAQSMKKKIEGHPGQVLSFETKEVKRNAPQLLNSSALKTAARKQLGFSTVRTTTILQGLYEKGYVSYPRADSRHLSENKANELATHLKKLHETGQFSELFPPIIESLAGKTRFVDDKKAATHHAIVPTDLEPTNLSDEELKLYELILRHTLAAHHPVGVDRETEVVTAVANETFKTRSVSVITPGWRTLLKPEAEEKEEQFQEDVTSDPIPSLEKGMAVKAVQADLAKGQTSKPKRLNDDELEKLMENAGKFVDDILDDVALAKIKEKGIGTPATRTNIVQSLVKREYIEIKKNLVYLTNKGRSFMDMVYEHPIASIELTGDFEKKLGDVENGMRRPEALLDEFRQLAHSVIDTKEALAERIQNNSMPVHAFSNVEEIGTCPCCKRPVIVTKKAYSCSGWKEGCKFTIWKEFRSVSIKVKQAKDLLAGKEVLLEKIPPSAEGKKPYDLYLKLQDGQISTRFPTVQDQGIGSCPLCSKPVIEGNKGFGCSGWKEGCKFTIWKDFRGMQLSGKDVAKLLKGREVSLSGIPKKDSGSYELILYLKEGKLESRFPTIEDSSLGKCPCCGKAVIGFEKMYGCSNWKGGCPFKISKEVLGVPISEAQLKKMLKHGKTDKLEGFNGPKEKFDSCISFSVEKGRISFVR
ncbi:type IA DNA topoisomerase [Paenibacillus alvei]|uniref:DNA topoisomerase n=1 Tax=Paenibacillus alvei TaxID=44250 RepID=UPI00227DA38A|nr:type IA DNA topoisomerase [Paenibacillus alvei]